MANRICLASLENETESHSANTSKSPEEQYADMIGHICMEIGIPVVCSFGLIGNTLNLLVLTREKQHRTLSKMEFSAHIGLIALAFSDFMFCLLALLFTLLPLKRFYDEQNMVLYYNWLGNGCITIFIVTSTWLTVVMAGERYMAVCHPFKARNLISLKRTRISVMGIFVVCTLCTLPIFLESKIHQIDCPNGDKFYTIKKRESFTRDVIVARRVVWAILFDFIPCVALIYFNICLIWKIHKAKKLRENMAPMRGRESTLLHQKSRNGNVKWQIKFKKANGNNSLQPPIQSRSHSLTHDSNNSSPKFNRHSSRKRNTESALNSVTATLVSVIILFLILVSPSEILKFTLYYTSKSLQKNHRFDIVKYITNFMQALNFSTNFVLYCAINKSFRNSLRSLCCWWWRKLKSRRLKATVIKLESD